MESGTRKRTTRELMLDLLLYILIGVALVVGVLLSVIYVPEKYQPSVQSFGLIFSTFVLVFFTLRASRGFWRRPMFWAACVGVFAARMVVWTFVLRAIPAFRFIWFAFAAPIELLIIAHMLGWCEVATERFRRFPSPKAWIVKPK